MFVYYTGLAGRNKDITVVNNNDGTLTLSTKCAGCGCDKSFKSITLLLLIIREMFSWKLYCQKH